MIFDSTIMTLVEFLRSYDPFFRKENESIERMALVCSNVYSCDEIEWSEM